MEGRNEMACLTSFFVFQCRLTNDAEVCCRAFCVWSSAHRRISMRMIPSYKRRQTQKGLSTCSSRLAVFELEQA
jgi:hypothetical protein